MYCFTAPDSSWSTGIFGTFVKRLLIWWRDQTMMKALKRRFSFQYLTMLLHRFGVKLFLRFQRRVFSKRETSQHPAPVPPPTLSYRWIFMPNRSMRKLSISGGRPTCRWTNGFPARIISVKLGHEATAMTSSSSSIWNGRERPSCNLQERSSRHMMNGIRFTRLCDRSRYCNSGNAGNEISSSSGMDVGLGVLPAFSSSSSKIVLLINTSPLFARPCWK